MIPSQDSLIGDLLSLDLNPPAAQPPPPAAGLPSNVDLLGGGLDALVSRPGLGRDVCVCVWGSMQKWRVLLN